MIRLPMSRKFVRFRKITHQFDILWEIVYESLPNDLPPGKGLRPSRELLELSQLSLMLISGNQGETP